MSHDNLKSLDDLDDILIVQKIEKKDPATSINEKIQATVCLCFKSQCDCEINAFVEEQEALIKKKRQMQEADERGRQALMTEIAILKERQANRDELLSQRQRALDIEKERARKIASLPPPLPKSVKSLLKKSENEPKINKCDAQMPDELTAIHIEPIDICYKSNENKENITDPEELEMRQKLQEEWEMKAKKRYYEALKKDRQKEEYSKIMKQIQSAELLNRQEMAKHVSAEKGVPCPLSDKFQSARKQVDMEDEAERIFKKTGTKEHVIEDIEGYKDHYEEKYKKIDSTTEAKMIDCVPSFVKENYDYLLEDDSKFLGGKNFSGFDESNSDILNEAYIETPPGADELHETREIFHEISHLDKIRSSLETEIEQNYKPLLAAAMEVPKKESRDQAVETESVKVLAEDKAVGTDVHFKNVVNSPSPTATFNFLNAGVMAFKRRSRLPILNTYEEMHLPYMHQRDVRYVMPLGSESNEPPESWSPSTYCSLPSKHGVPAFANGSKSAVCDICIAEMKKDHIRSDNFIHKPTPVSAVLNEENKLTDSAEKSPLSEYVQQLAEKYLVKKSFENSSQSENNVKSFNDSACLNTKTTSPAFEKEVVGKSKVGKFSEPDKSKETTSVTVKKTLPEQTKKFQTSPLAIETAVPTTKAENFIKMNEAGKIINKNENLQDDIYSKITENELKKKSDDYSEYDYEVKRLRAIHQVLSRNFPQTVINDNEGCEEKKYLKESKELTSSAQNEMPAPAHIYHELSTIQEVDSGLTSSSLQLSQSKISEKSAKSKVKDVSSKKKLNDKVQSTDRLKMVSLLDPPDTEIAELAKSIHFVPETEKEIGHNLETSEIAVTNSFGDKFVSSKEHLSTPSFTTGSYSSKSVSTPSLLLSSSSQRETKENTDSQNCIISGYISDYEIQDTSESEDLHPKQDVKDMNIKTSRYMSELNVPQLTTAVDMLNPHKETNEMHSIISGYISDFEISPTSISDAHCLAHDKKTAVNSLSGSNNDLNAQHMVNSNTSHFMSKGDNVHLVTPKYDSDLNMPEGIKTGIPPFCNENKDNEHFIKNESIKNNNTPHRNNSAKFLPMTPHSDISSPNTYNNTNYSALKFDDLKKIASDKKFSLKQGKFLTQMSSSSEGSFQPMTPHSNISSSSGSINHALKEKFQNDNVAGNFKLMSPYSSSSSVEFGSHDMKRYSKEDSSGCFKPMTPHSNVSSPTELNSHNLEKNYQEDNFMESLKPIPPHSNVSSPNKLPNLSSVKDIQNSNSTGSFKALTAHSDISTPSTFGSFKTLTPHSNISSPSGLILPYENSTTQDVNSERLKDKALLEDNKIKPVILRFDISTDSLTLSSIKNNQPMEAKHVSQLNCNVTLKTLLKPTKYGLVAEKTEIIPTAIDNRKYIDRPKYNSKKRHKGLQLTTPKQYALACSSDFFIPSMCEDLGSSNVPDANKDIQNNPETVFDSEVIISDNVKKTGKKLERISEGNESALGSVNSSKEVLSEAVEEEIFKKSKVTCEAQVLLENVRKQCSNMQGSSSASSSSENLSVISSSKVVYQSTPIKNLSELLQEPGILEEPNLTLINTDMSCKMDTTEIPKGPLISVSSNELVHRAVSCINKPQNECRTPISVSPQFSGSPDTPSMISFLQHEMSCVQAGNNSVASMPPAVNYPTPTNLQGNNTPVSRVMGVSQANNNAASQNSKENYASVSKEVKRSLFPKAGYKERTKRLWNNLEEVRKKNLAEERKKEIENNRKKAKDFAKKLTPKQRKKMT